MVYETKPHATRLDDACISAHHGSASLCASRRGQGLRSSRLNQTADRWWAYDAHVRATRVFSPSVALLVALFVALLVACAQEDTSRANDGATACTLHAECSRGQCVDGRCVSANDADASDPSTIPIGEDTSLRHDVADADVGDEDLLDTDTDEDPEAGPDSPDNVVGLGLIPCNRETDCPVAETRCVRTLPLALPGDPTSYGEVSIRELFPNATHDGVCTMPESCNVEGADPCASARDPRGAWSCMVVGGAPTYVSAEQPVDTDLMRRGTPYAALCVPPPSAGATCMSCTSDDHCASGYRCVSLGFDERVCLAPCTSDAICSHDTTCRDVNGGGSYCVTPMVTCRDCADLDGDGYGVGRCGPRGEATPEDCDDHDADRYFSDSWPFDTDACDDRDRNCNGIPDRADVVGPDGLLPTIHCRRCDDPCDASVLGAGLDFANAAATCAFPDTLTSDHPPASAAQCVPGCAPGFGDCDGDPTNGCESDLTNDETCGRCESTCVGSAPHVEEASCDTTMVELEPVCRIGLCEDGFESCDDAFSTGCETSISNEPDHCGGCDTRCGPVANGDRDCVDATCVAVCHVGFADCDGTYDSGCETAIDRDPENCGACGVLCTGLPHVGSSTCAGGACEILTCSHPARRSCDEDAMTGCETDTRTDPHHCAACGASCMDAPQVADARCADSVCSVLSCAEGYGDCNQWASDGCETTLDSVDHCGACHARCEPVHPNLGVACADGECQCVDRFPDERCNGLPDLCDTPADEGCPASLEAFYQANDLHEVRTRGAGATGDSRRCQLTGDPCDVTIVERQDVSCPAPQDCGFGGCNFLERLNRRLMLSAVVVHYNGDGFINAVTPHWSRPHVVGDPTRGVNDNGDFNHYALDWEVVEADRMGSVASRVVNPVDIMMTCPSDAMIVGLSIKRDPFVGGFNGQAIILMCRRYEITPTGTGSSPMERYRFRFVGSATPVFPNVSGTGFGGGAILDTQTDPRLTSFGGGTPIGPIVGARVWFQSAICGSAGKQADTGYAMMIDDIFYRPVRVPIALLP